MANTNFSPSQVHAIVEIGTAKLISAKELSEKLCLEKSSVSRMVAKLIASGEIEQTRNHLDSRAKQLSLTPKGDKLLAEINNFADQQVNRALDRLAQTDQRRIVDGLKLYVKALNASRTENSTKETKQNSKTLSVSISRGHVVGLLGRTVEMHAMYYRQLVGFGVEFESKVASEYAEFLTRLQQNENAVWYVKTNDKIAGNIVIDGQALGGNTGLLRWFIIDDSARGTGVGNQLMAKAMTFCDQQGFAETHLWTFKGLDAARRLYEKFGFELVEEQIGTSWGKEVVEQKFVRKLNPKL